MVGGVTGLCTAYVQWQAVLRAGLDTATTPDLLLVFLLFCYCRFSVEVNSRNKLIFSYFLELLTRNVNLKFPDICLFQNDGITCSGENIRKLECRDNSQCSKSLSFYKSFFNQSPSS